MDQLKQACIDFLTNIIRTIGSGKFWALVLTAAMAAFVAIEAGQSMWAVAIAVVTVLIGSGTYMITKTKQNIELAKTGIIQAKTNGNGGGVIKSNGKARDLPVANPTWPTSFGRISSIFADVFPYRRVFLPHLVTVQQKVDTGLNFMGTIASPNVDAIWDFFAGWLTQKIHDALAKMLAANPDMETIEAVRIVVESYLNKPCSEEDCKAILATRGLFDAIQSFKMQGIYISFHDAFMRGRDEKHPHGGLGKGKWEELIGVARQEMVKQIVNDAAFRVFNDKADIKEREQALREFGIAEENIKRAVWSGSVVILGDGEYFNPYWHVKQDAVPVWV